MGLEGLTQDEIVKAYDDAHFHFVLMEFEKYVHKRGVKTVMKELGEETVLDIFNYVKEAVCE